MTARDFFLGPGHTRDRALQAFEGQAVRNASFQSVTGINDGGQAAQVSTIAIPASPDNSTTYSVTVNGITASYTTDASATQAELGAGLESAINNKGGIRGILSAAYAGGTLTLTATWAGVAFTVTASGGSGGAAIGTPATATSASSATDIRFGRLLGQDGYDDLTGSMKVFLPTSSNLTAQVDTLTFVFASGEIYLVDLTFEGETYKFEIAANTDATTTASDFATAVNARMPANSIDASPSSGVVTLTSEKPGQFFEVAYGTQDGTAANLVHAQSTDTAKTDIRRWFAGVSVRRLDVENVTIDGNDPAYDGNDGVEVCRRGRVWMAKDTTESISLGDDLYVETSSSDAGKVFNTKSATRLLVPKDLIVWSLGEYTGNADGLQQIRIERTAA